MLEPSIIELQTAIEANTASNNKLALEVQSLRSSMNGVDIVEDVVSGVDTSDTTSATEQKPSVVVSNFDELPAVEDRPFPAKVPVRTPKKIDDFEKALTSGDSSIDHLFDLHTAMVNYQLGASQKHSNKLKSITPTADQIDQHAEATRYINIEVNHYIDRKEISKTEFIKLYGLDATADQSDTTAGKTTPPPPKKTPPTPPAKNTANEVIPGYVLADTSPDATTYEEWLDSEWTDELLIEHGHVVPVS